MIMAISEYGDSSSTCYEEIRRLREKWIYVKTYDIGRIEIAVKKEPSWPQERKDKRKNFINPIR